MDRLDGLDVSLFDGVEIQMSYQDRRSLLALHGVVADRLRDFVYLEIGSHKGGSLQVFAQDKRCRKIVSIDPRPEWQPDDARPGGCAYRSNSTQDMLDALAAIPGVDVMKIETIELSSEQIDPAGVERPDLCVVDAEHTYAAVLRDARFCRDVLRGQGVIAFHDFGIVPGAILRFLQETHGARGYLLRDQIWVVEIEVPTLISDRRVREQLRRPAAMWGPLNAIGAIPLLLTANRLRRWLRRRF